VAKRKRKYVCEGPFATKRDATAEAAIIRQIGHKATVKRASGGYKVCRTYKKR
jgi:hypothetical protein